METAAEAEIAALQSAREALAERQAEADQERRRSEMEREEMGATWGMGKSSFVGGYGNCEPFLPYCKIIVVEEATGGCRNEEVVADEGREAYYRDDPKKALRKYFEREGEI